MPEVSVVVATHNRAPRLRRLLAALEAQEGAPDFEVVVVDDGSTDATPAVLAAAAAAGSRVRSVRRGRPSGPAAARNAGWRAARAPVIAFTDDDCVPAPGWLAALWAAGEDVVQGRVEPDPAEPIRSPWARTIRIEGPTPYFQTCNIRYPRSLLERLGGFDEWFSYPVGEDTDLGWRAKAAGATVGFAAGALVHHAVHDLRPRDVVRGTHKWHQGVRAVKRHPGLRAHFTHRVFWKPSHERLLAAAALAAARRPLPAAAALAWWAAGHRPAHGSWAGTVARLPSHLIIDGAEIAAMARGSARERTLLL